MLIPNRFQRFSGKYTDYLKQRQYANSTIHGNQKSVLDFISWLDGQRMEVEQVESRDVLAYIKYKQKRGIAQSTVRAYVGSIRTFYDYKISTGCLDINPAEYIKIQGVKSGKLYYTFSAEELNRLYNNYQPDQIIKLGGRTDHAHCLIESRNKVMLGLYVYQGIQTKELIKLKTDHIKLREGLIDIPETRRSNGRTLKLEPHQILDIYDYILKLRPQILELSGQETDRLAISPKGGDKVSNFVNTLRRELKRQNKLVENVQQLRASVIVKWLKQYNLREVQYRAGHRYASSTEHYLINEVEGLAEELEQFHPLS